MLKFCIKCKEDKPLKDFSKDNSTSDKLYSSCKECVSKKYRDNKVEVSKRQSKRYREKNLCKQNRDRLRARKLEYIKYKGGVCTECGKMPHPAAMDFHHVNPAEKKFNLAPTNKLLIDVVEELDKCILLCSNCHRILHSEEKDDA